MLKINPTQHGKERTDKTTNQDIFLSSSVNGFGLLHMGVFKNGGTQQPWVFLLKMIILGCFGGTTIWGNTHMIFRISSGWKILRPPGTSSWTCDWNLWQGWWRTRRLRAQRITRGKCLVGPQRWMVYNRKPLFFWGNTHICLDILVAKQCQSQQIKVSRFKLSIK